MLERLILPLVLGVLSSLIANWITATWTRMGNEERWIMSGVIGLITGIVVAFTFSHSREKPAASIEEKPALPKDRILGENKAENLKVGNVNLETEPQRDLDALSDNDVRRDLVVGDVTVKRGQRSSDE